MAGNEGNGRVEMIFQMTQKTNDHILEMVKENSDVKSSQKDLTLKMGLLGEDMKKLSESIASFASTLTGKMTPDRCAHIHNDLKKQIFKEMKDGAQGWARRGLIALKILAYISATFGGSAVGASALGLLP